MSKCHYCQMVIMIVHFLACLLEHLFHNMYNVYKLNLDSSKPNFKHVTKALYIFHSVFLFLFHYIFFLYIYVTHISTCLSIHIPFHSVITLHIHPLSIHSPISLYDNPIYTIHPLSIHGPIPSYDNPAYTPSFYLRSHSIL